MPRPRIADSAIWRARQSEAWGGVMTVGRGLPDHANPHGRDAIERALDHFHQVQIGHDYPPPQRRPGVFRKLLRPERAYVADQRPPIALRQVPPGGHGAASRADLPEDLAVGLGLDLL